MSIEAELRRRNQSGTLVPWTVNDDGTDPVADAAVLEALGEIRDHLAGGLDVSPIIATYAKAGRLFIGGHGRIVVNEPANVRALVSNPGGSGVVVALLRLAVFSSAVGYMNFHRDATTGLPALDGEASNALLVGGFTPLASYGADVDTDTALGGGVDLHTTVGLGAQTRTVLDLPPLLLPPGHTFGFNVPFSTGTDMAFSLYWAEEPLA